MNFSGLSDRAEIEVRIAELRAQKRARRKRTTFICLLALVFVALGIVGVVVASNNATQKDAEKVLAFSAVIGLYAALAIPAALFFSQRASADLDLELDVLQTKLRLLEAPNQPATAAQDQTGSYFDRLVDINVNNLSAYYGLVKLHATNGFLLAASAGVVGFGFLLLSLLAAQFGSPSTPREVTYIAAVAGVLTEFIAAVFFFIYSRTVAQLKEYHDSLLAVQNVLLSFKLVGDTENPEQKAQMVAQMLQYLVGSRQASSSLSTGAP